MSSAASWCAWSLTGFPARVSRLYAADLAGAALGCVLLIVVIGYSDGPTAVLWVAVLAAIGAMAFASRRALASASSCRDRRRHCCSLVAALGHTVLVWREFPVFRILYMKGSFEARPLYEKWNSYSRVRVRGSQKTDEPPQGWGLSPVLPESSRVRQMQMDIDVGAGTVLTGYSTVISQAVQHLKYDVTNIGYYLQHDPSVLVIGAGGGRDVLSALVFGAKSVTAVEINKDIIRTVNGRFGDFTGHLDRDPRVRFVNDEARSLCRQIDGAIRHDPDLAHRHVGGHGRRRLRPERELALHRRGLDDVSPTSDRRRHPECLALVLPGPSRGDVSNDDAGGRGAARGGGDRPAPAHRRDPQHAAGQPAGGHA